MRPNRRHWTHVVLVVLTLVCAAPLLTVLDAGAARLSKRTLTRAGSGNDRFIEHTIRDTFRFVASGTTIVGWAEDFEMTSTFALMQFRGAHLEDLESGTFLYPLTGYDAPESYGLWTDLAPDDVPPLGFVFGPMFAFSDVVPGREYEFAIEFIAATTSTLVTAGYELYEANDILAPNVMGPALERPSLLGSLQGEDRLSGLVGDWDGDGNADLVVVKAASSGLSFFTPAGQDFPLGDGWIWPEPSLGVSTEVFAGRVDEDASHDRLAFDVNTSQWYIRYAANDSVPAWDGTEGDVGAPGEVWFAGVGDYDGNGTIELFNVRRSDALTEVRDARTFALLSSSWPAFGDTTVASIAIGDWDGDGSDRVAYRPQTGFGFARGDGAYLGPAALADSIVVVRPGSFIDSIVAADGSGPGGRYDCIGDCVYTCTDSPEFSCDDLPPPDPCDPLDVPNSCDAVSFVDMVAADFDADGSVELAFLRPDGRWQIEYALAQILRPLSGGISISSSAVDFQAPGTLEVTSCVALDAPLGTLALEVRGRVGGAIVPWTIVESRDLLLDSTCETISQFVGLAPGDSVEVRAVAGTSQSSQTVDLGIFTHQPDPDRLLLRTDVLPSSQGWSFFSQANVEADVFSTDGASLFLDSTSVPANGRVNQSTMPIEARPGSRWSLQVDVVVLGERLNVESVPDSVGRLSFVVDDGTHALHVDLGRDLVSVRGRGSAFPVDLSQVRNLIVESAGTGTARVSITDVGVVYDGPMDVSLSPQVSFGDASTIQTDVSARIDFSEFRWGAPTGVSPPASSRSKAPRLHVQPNPFNPRATLMIDLPRATHVRIEIYDIRGRSVRTLVAGDAFDAGVHRFVWDGRDERGFDVASSVYHAVLRTEDAMDRRKLVLVR